MKMREVIFRKTISIGKIEGIYENRAVPVKVTVEVYRDAKGRLCLSMVGDILNWSHQGSIECGQIQDTIIEAIQAGGFKPAGMRLAMLLAIWEEYHLNGMQAYACSHMEVYLKHATPELNVKTGFALSTPCPICGYKHGHRWNYRKIPNDIIAFLRDF